MALCRTAGAAEEGAARRYLQKAKYDALSVALPERLSFREAMNRGGSLIETRDKKLNACAQAVIDELVKKVRLTAGKRTSGARKEQAG